MCGGFAGIFRCCHATLARGGHRWGLPGIELGCCGSGRRLTRAGVIVRPCAQPSVPQ